MIYNGCHHKPSGCICVGPLVVFYKHQFNAPALTPTQPHSPPCQSAGKRLGSGQMHGHQSRRAERWQELDSQSRIQNHLEIHTTGLMTEAQEFKLCTQPFSSFIPGHPTVLHFIKNQKLPFLRGFYFYLGPVAEGTPHGTTASAKETPCVFSRFNGTPPRGGLRLGRRGPSRRRTPPLKQKGQRTQTPLQ